MAKKKKLTDASKANQSGMELENRLKKYLIENNIAFKQQRPRQPEIDFVIAGKIYADCTNQNVEGSVQEKIPHKIWKYYRIYSYKDVYIIRGEKIPDPPIIEHCDEIAERYNFRWHLVTFDEFCEILATQNLKYSLQNFYVEEEENVCT